MSTQGGLNIVTDGLVFEVDAANKLGGNVSSTKNLTNPTETGTFVNGASVVNGVYDFDGVDDYIDFGNIIGNQMLSDFTIELWVYLKSTANNFFPLFHKRDGANDDTTSPFNMYVDNRTVTSSSMRLYYSMGDNGTGFGVNTFGDAAYNNYLTPNQWTNILVKISGVNVSIYRDSILFGTLTYSGTRVNNTASLELARYDPNDFGDWEISNVKIYNKALTPTEIKQNYEALKHRFDDN